MWIILKRIAAISKLDSDWQFQARFKVTILHSLTRPKITIG